MPSRGASRRGVCRVGARSRLRTCSGVPISGRRLAPVSRSAERLPADSRRTRRSPARRSPAPGTASHRFSPLQGGVSPPAPQKSVCDDPRRPEAEWGAASQHGTVAAVLPHFATGQLHPSGALHSHGHTRGTENGSVDLRVCNSLMLPAAICGSVEAASVLRYAHHLDTAVRSGSATAVPTVAALQPRRRRRCNSPMSEILLH